MISKMAIEDCQAMLDEGIALTPCEIVRLNALGCKCEGHPDVASFYALPRCAFLGDVVFREPSIGHQLWMDNVCRMYDEDDETTSFMLKAYALSKTNEQLPEWTDAKSIEKELKLFITKTLCKFTVRQVIACVNYCMNGSDAIQFEFPEVSEESLNKISKIDMDEPYSSAVGVIHESQALKLGISIADACKMTQSALQAVIQRAYESAGIEVDKQIRNRAIGDYYVTLESIKKAHSDGRQQNQTND